MIRGRNGKAIGARSRGDIIDLKFKIWYSKLKFEIQ